jgi:hypothetical protein
VPALSEFDARRTEIAPVPLPLVGVTAILELLVVAVHATGELPLVCVIVTFCAGLR